MLEINFSKLNKYIWLVFFITYDVNAWTIQHSYDSQSSGDKCNGWNSTGSTVSSDQSAIGKKSCKQSVDQSATGFGEWGGIIALPENLKNGGEIWIRVRAFWPSGFNYDASTSALKFIRVHTRDSENENYGYNDWYIKAKNSADAFYYRYEGEPKAQNHAFGTGDDKIKNGVWETYEFNLKLDTVPVDEGGKARSRMWKNGKLIGEVTVTPTMQQSQGYVDKVHIFTYWNGGSPQTQHMYIDDVTMTNERPSEKDIAGNWYIGMGGFIPVAAPNPPSLVQENK